MSRFVVEGPLSEGGEVRLSPEESHHLARVLRMKAGERLELADGRGTVAGATLVDASAKGATARVETLFPIPPHSRLTLAFGIPKGAALEFLVRRVTEVGVAAFQPLLTQHSLHVKEWNEGRWRKHVVEVSKQCEEAWFPELEKPRKLADWLATRDPARLLVFCDEAERTADLEIGTVPGCDLLVGAEGGWSDEERKTILGGGALPLGLGRNRLRAETAALVAAVLVKERLGEV